MKALWLQLQQMKVSSLLNCWIINAFVFLVWVINRLSQQEELDRIRRQSITSIPSALLLVDCSWDAARGLGSPKITNKQVCSDSSVPSITWGFILSGFGTFFHIMYLEFQYNNQQWHSMCTCVKFGARPDFFVSNCLNVSDKGDGGNSRWSP